MLADVVSPFFHPVILDVLDRIDAEAIAVRGVDEVPESLGDPIGDMRRVGGQIVGAFELTAQGFRESVPVVDRAVIVEVGQLVEREGMATVAPPAVAVVAAGPVLFVVVGAVAEQPVQVGGVVDDHVEDHVDAAGVAGVDQVLEFLERPLRGVDVEEIRGVVLMIGRVASIAPLGVHLYAGNPDGVDTHAAQVVEVFPETFPVAAVVEVAVVGEGSAAVADEPRRAVDPHRTGCVVGRIAVGKTVGKNLVHIDVAPILRGREIGVPGRPRGEAVGRVKYRSRDSGLGEEGR